MAKQGIGKVLVIGLAAFVGWQFLKGKTVGAIARRDFVTTTRPEFTTAEKNDAEAILRASGTSEAEITRILAEAKPSVPITQAEWVKQVAESWQTIPGNVTGGVTARTLAEAGIAPSTGAIGQAQYQVNQAVFALPGGKDNPQFRALIEGGYSSGEALALMDFR
jgi:hypothetical protein